SELEGAEKHIRSVIDNIMDGMITVDDSGVIRSMNPAAEKMFGCRDNEMIGHNLTRLVPKRYESEHDSKPVVCNWTELMGRTGGSTLALGRTRKHVTFPVEMSLSEMIIDQQRVYVAMVRDVTERKDRKSTRLNSSHVEISYAVFCLKKKIKPATQGRASITKTAH